MKCSAHQQQHSGSLFGHAVSLALVPNGATHIWYHVAPRHKKSSGLPHKSPPNQALQRATSQLRCWHASKTVSRIPWYPVESFRTHIACEGVLNIFYPRTQIGFHMEPDPDIRRSTCFPFQLCRSKYSLVDSLAINSLFNDVTIENITPITTTHQVV